MARRCGSRLAASLAALSAAISDADLAAAQPGAGLQVRQNLSLVLGLQGKLGEAEKILRENLPPDQANADLAYLQSLKGPAPAATPTAAPSRTWDAVKGAGG